MGRVGAVAEQVAILCWRPGRRRPQLCMGRKGRVARCGLSVFSGVRKEGAPKKTEMRDMLLDSGGRPP